MVSKIFEKFEKHFKSNLERYVKEHPEEYVILENLSNIQESFYKTHLELEEYISIKYSPLTLLEIFPKEGKSLCVSIKCGTPPENYALFIQKVLKK
ncbi:MAG: hypothetical protein KKA65_03410 [Nanoarchaeota archaeon]|nr:hypothetical protein [Nanoarchaeota archaeon]MBU4352043.1 hypothetical protein [Nanoarchaeota archaeon]MBU4456526.1 hypothetical protein [Nanoarchaeota archaeon]MCG2719298.1 hypothetical protein [Nanoarchaeota archaeon]